MLCWVHIAQHVYKFWYEVKPIPFQDFPFIYHLRKLLNHLACFYLVPDSFPNYWMPHHPSHSYIFIREKGN